MLTDSEGDQAYAAFNWANFAGGVKTVTSQLNPTEFFDPTSIVNWQILGGAPDGVAVNATLYGAAAVSPTQTDTVIDDFSVSIPNLNNDAGPDMAASTVLIAGFSNARRTVQTQAGALPANALVELGNGTLAIAATESGSGTSLLYDDFLLYSSNQPYLAIDFAEARNLDQPARSGRALHADGPPPWRSAGGLKVSPSLREARPTAPVGHVPPPVGASRTRRRANLRPPGVGSTVTRTSPPTVPGFSASTTQSPRARSVQVSTV